MTRTYTANSAAAAIAASETTIDAVAAATGWPIYEGCLIPEPRLWHADDGNAEITEGHDSAQEAAQSYVDGGDWGIVEETTWIAISVWRTGIDADGATVILDAQRIRITLEPVEPACIEGQEHDWQSPLSIVGGCKEAPGVYGHGGGVTIQEVCVRCGCGKLIDTWAQDPNTGEQGLHSVRYQPGRYADQVTALREDS